MIGKSEIDAKAEELGVHVANVQRDYVFGWLLSGISQPNNPLQRLLVLKGGNCFRKAYFEHTRFSNDLDFSTQVELDVRLFVQGLKQACVFGVSISIGRPGVWVVRPAGLVFNWLFSGQKPRGKTRQGTHTGINRMERSWI